MSPSYRLLATPIPLAFLALGLAGGTFGAVELRLVPQDQTHLAGLVALAVTAPLQALACLVGFVCHDPVAGTGTGVQAGTWAVVGVATLTSPPGSESPGLGVFLLLVAAAMTVPVVAGLDRPLAAVVMGLSGLRFGVAGVDQLTAATAWRELAGGLGILLAATALVAAMVFERRGLRTAEETEADEDTRGAGRTETGPDGSSGAVRAQ